MPDRAAQRLSDMVDRADFMIPASQSDVTALAMVEAIRASADVSKRVAEALTEVKNQLTELNQTVHGIDKRVALIEANSIERDVMANRADIKKLADRVDALESEQARREGQARAFDLIVRYGPLAALMVMVLVVLVVAGKVHF